MNFTLMTFRVLLLTDRTKTNVIHLLEIKVEEKSVTIHRLRILVHHHGII